MSRRAGWLARLKPDVYILLILGMVVLASLLPARGATAPAVDGVTKLAIGLTFFLNGARLPREAIIAALVHWRLHLVILGVTFAAFPIAGVSAASLPGWIVPAALAPGLIFLACLPSTVQSAISFTTIARGNIASAVASASASNLLAIVATPLLVAFLLHTEGGGFSLDQAQRIALQLLAPFIAGHLARPLIGAFVARHNKRLGWIDRGAILLVVYGAFSDAVIGGLWSQVSAFDLGRLALICLMLLAFGFALPAWVGRAMRFDKGDRIALLFAGSNKGLVFGVPIAGVLFPPETVGFMLLPVMIYHQLQLIVCAGIAQRYAREADRSFEAR
ncbi:MAG TPA: bile acid:sodium symporter family protein [Phenylobacterium sp.]|nr:bile acid:sodium symporter family protein [Phenylobacterium sp.]